MPGVPRAARRCAALRGTARPVRRRRGAPRRARLVGEYDELVDAALELLGPDTARTTRREIAELPDVVRGYEDVKLRNVERFRSRGVELIGEMSSKPIVIGRASMAGTAR